MKNGKSEFIKNWDSYINDLERLAWNLTDKSDRESLHEHISELKRLARVAALEQYQVQVEDDVDGYLKAYRIA